MAAWHQANTDSFQIAHRRPCQAPLSTYTLRGAQRHWRHQRHLRPRPAPQAPWQIRKKPRGLLIYLACLQRNVSQLSILQTITWRSVGCHPWEKKHSVRGKSLGSSVLCRVSQTEFRRTALNLMVIRCIADVRHKLMKSQWALWFQSKLKTVKDEQVWMVPIFIFPQYLCWISS